MLMNPTAYTILKFDKHENAFRLASTYKHGDIIMLYLKSTLMYLNSFLRHILLRLSYQHHVHHMDILFGTPLHVTPGPELGASSS